MENLKNRLTGMLVGLARATDSHDRVRPTEETYKLLIRGLAATDTATEITEEKMRELMQEVHVEKLRLTPGCSACVAQCGRNSDYDMNEFWSAEEEVLSMKCTILYGIRGLAEKILQVKEYNGDCDILFAKTMFAIGGDWSVEDLVPIVIEVGQQLNKYKAV